MRKTFPLSDPRHKPARVVESIKNNIRKYVKRERRKDLPKGADYWDFDCRVGKTKESATSIHLAEVISHVDKAANEAWTELYVEILAKPARRNPRGDKASSAETETESTTNEHKRPTEETIAGTS